MKKDLRFRLTSFELMGCGKVDKRIVALWRELPWCVMRRSPYKTSIITRRHENGQRLAANADYSSRTPSTTCFCILRPARSADVEGAIFTRVYQVASADCSRHASFKNLMCVFLFFVLIVQSPKVVPEHLFDYVVPQLEPFDQRMAIVKACIDAGPKYFFLKLLSVSKCVRRIRDRTADD